MTNLEMRNLPDHYPHREDQVEAWLKERRDEHVRGSALDTAWDAIDNLLDEYRLAADTGRSLEEMVNEDLYEEERQQVRPRGEPKKKKNPRKDN